MSSATPLPMAGWAAWTPESGLPKPPGFMDRRPVLH